MMKQVNIKIPRRMLTLLLGLLLSVGAFAQTDVKGNVKDAQGEPIIGATVRVVGTQAATVTDFDGNFVLKAKNGADLEISYIGYQTQTVKAGPNIIVVLQDDATVLNDLVVIGYGAVKKSDLTGSVTALKPDGKNKGVVVSAQDMLGGKVAGVAVTSYSGEPGGNAQIRIRGGSSLSASNDPLIVIDGVPMDNNSVGDKSNILGSINPQDIESFNVLKDASATAIYGSRGSNGVIIITTKKGHKGQAPTVSYAGSVTVSMKQKTLDVMNADQYRALLTDKLGAGAEALNFLGTANTDWQSLIYRTAISHDHNVTVAGSAGKVLPYRVSLGYTGQQGILKTSSYNRYTASLNLNPSLLNDHLVLNLNAKGMISKARKADAGAVGTAVSFDPTQDPHNFTSPYHTGLLGNSLAQTLQNFGGYFEWPTGASALGDAAWPFTKFGNAPSNPLAMLELRDNQEKVNTFIGSADLDYKVHGFEDLRLHATLGAEVAAGTLESNQPQAYPGAIYYGGVTDNWNLKRNHLLSAYAQYYHDFNDQAKNHFDIMGGYEWQHFYFRYDNLWTQYYPSTAATAGDVFSTSPDIDQYENYLVSFFGRANWSLMDRYYVTATVRRDGSSRFKDHWSTFPSFAFAWKMKDENRLRNVSWLSDLKLRLGWGMTGQQDVGDNYAWIAKYSKGVGSLAKYPLMGTQDDGTLYRPSDVNYDLKWETTTTYNVGLDFGFFNQRFTGSVDWYYRMTTDLLNWAPLAALAGFSDNGNQNIGDLRNTGVEVSLEWKALQSKDWYWTIGYNFTYNQNRITNLTGVSENGQPVKTGDNIDQTNQVLAHQVGYPANSFYVYQQAYDEAGKPIEGAVVDRNADGQITEEDRYLYKSAAAPITMGLTSRLEYKNWDFGFSLRANIGNYVYNSVEQGQRLTTQSALWAQSQFLNNRTINTLGWSSDEMPSKLSDYFVQNASFLKCDNITLGYSFADLFKSGNWHGLSGRVYATASNVFTITKYDGIDPEVYNGIDSNLYPRPFSVIVGLNLNF
ncbi:MAG: TonB-dependent receptor [Prevotella sp.]|nr:TonB-dependent receptor [Prevotella sp.]